MDYHEKTLLLDSIKTTYGYDFTDYKQSSLDRRLKHFLSQQEKYYLREIIPSLVNDKIYFQNFVDSITIQVTEFFREPTLFNFFRENIIPHLTTYPRINIWSAGSATGEEALSLAILAKESGILNKTHIYATDISSRALLQAKEGIYDIAEIQKNEENYLRSGGSENFSDFYRKYYNRIIFHEELRSAISFFKHNIVSDASFIDAQVIFCTNVLIYFNENLQRKVISLLHESLTPSGFLILGMKERIHPEICGMYFQKISDDLPVYRKINPVISRTVNSRK